MSEQYDCRACGACCNSFTDLFYYARVLDTDSKKLVSVAMPDGRRALPVIQNSSPLGRCVYLEGEVGIEVNCSIYSDRPWVCQQFTIGGKSCLAARKRIGLVD